MSHRMVQCGACGTANRLPADRDAKGARCGKCRAPLPAILERPVDISDADFEEEVLRSPLPVLVDCWASWCGPCRIVAPILEDLARDYTGRLKVAKLNTEENRVIPAKFGIQSIPTLLLFHRGELVDTMVGALPRRMIEERLRGVL